MRLWTSHFSRAIRYLDDQFDVHTVFLLNFGWIDSGRNGSVFISSSGDDLMRTVVGNAVHAAIETFITQWKGDPTTTPGFTGDLRRTAQLYIERSWDPDYKARMISDRGNFDIKEWPSIKSRHFSQANKMMLAFLKQWVASGFQSMQCFALEEMWQEGPLLLCSIHIFAFTVPLTFVRTTPSTMSTT